MIYLIRTSLDLRQTDVLSNQLFMMQDRVIPGQLQEVQNSSHLGLGMKHELFIVDLQIWIIKKANFLYPEYI